MTLTMGQKAGWGLADMGIVVFVIIKQLLVLAFLTSYLGIDAATAGAIATGVLLFDMITDPAIGYLSDKTNSRWGRRVPWMVIGAVVLAAGTYLMFAVPPGRDPGFNALWFTGFFVMATIGFTMVSIPYGATAGEMTQDAKERSAMVAWRMGFASVGILIGGALLPALAGNSLEGHARAALIVAPVVIAAIWLSVFITRKAPRIMLPSSVSPLKMMRLVLSNRAFVTLAVLYGVMTFAVALITAGLAFAVIYLIEDQGGTPLSGLAGALGPLSLLLGMFVLGSILSQIVWVILSNRIGKTGALCVGLAAYIGLLFALYLALPSTNVTVVAGLFLIAGFTNGSYQQIPWAMYPDLMDVTRAETGEAIEGAFSAIWLFGQKLANALAPGAMGLILAVFGWRSTTEGRVEQLPEAVNALHYAMTLVPAGIFALSIFCLLAIYAPKARRVLA
ncbi:MFS transporter [Shimia ponticola]|uniref:MFS transporter n=1 Tax=Shimia ponticola TaxID=2582893 RepID=UPI0011BEBF6F|nr:MFS transporter [Shimia ponticola]